jgi:catechol 2,3-dioxygenase-like lactoylglutathione lyase family enzyme
MRGFFARLGWREAIAAEDFSAFSTGGAVLGLYDLEQLCADAAVPLPTADPGAFRGVTIAVNVEAGPEVDEALRSAQEAGATILREARDAPWGGRTGYFADPEGNVWEVAWMPGSSFDQRGALVLPSDQP